MSKSRRGRRHRSLVRRTHEFEPDHNGPAGTFHDPGTGTTVVRDGKGYYLKTDDQGNTWSFSQPVKSLGDLFSAAVEATQHHQTNQLLAKLRRR